MALVHALYHLGVLSVLRAIRLRKKAVVLMYHRVLTDEQQRRTGSNPGIVIGRDTFARQMRCLKDQFTVVSIDEFADRMRRQVPFEDASCLITFDDGWMDNFENALPILRAESIPAVIFLPVNFTGTDRAFWRETLTVLLARIIADIEREPRRRAAYERILQPAGLAAALAITDRDPRGALSETLEPLKRLGSEEVQPLIERLSAEAGVQVKDLTVGDRFMGWDQVREMAQQGIVFGGHGAEHRLLGQVSQDDAEREIATARTVIGDRIPPPVYTFSYPNGSWTASVAEQVRTSGFQLAFTTEAGSVDIGDEPLALRRVNISEDMTRSTPMFLARILGLV